MGNNALAFLAARSLDAHKYIRAHNIELMNQISAYYKAVHASGHSVARAPKTLADVFEALMAAVYFDSCGDIALMYRLFMPLIKSSAEDFWGWMEEDGAKTQGGGEKWDMESDAYGREADAIKGREVLHALFKDLKDVERMLLKDDRDLDDKKEEIQLDLGFMGRLLDDENDG